MNIHKSISLQKQVRDNSEDLQREFLDLKNWEEEMKRKDLEIRSSGADQVLPPMRNKKMKKKAKDTNQSKISEIKKETTEKRIKSSDYDSWNKFDADKACKEIDKIEDDESGDELLSQEELEKNHAEAVKHKEQGNIFVKQQKWDKALACYSAAIKEFPYDAVFYANRALCHLKRDDLYSAEADCTTALQLDDTYVKAYHRRATVRIALKRYEEAKQDLEKVLKMDSNKETKLILSQVEEKLKNLKPSTDQLLKKHSRKDVSIDKSIGLKLWSNAEPKKETVNIGKASKEITNKAQASKESSRKEKSLPERFPWIPENLLSEDLEVIQPIKKAPHQRSKKPLRRVPVKEADFCRLQLKDFSMEAAKTSSEFEDKSSHSADEKENNEIKDSVTEEIRKEEVSNRLLNPAPSIQLPNVPKTAVQFLTDWRKNKSTEFRYLYLKQISTGSLASIFKDSLESDIFAEIIATLRNEFLPRNDRVYSFLKDLSHVKRFRALIMFLGRKEKEDLKILVNYCKDHEHKSAEDIQNLLVLYEIEMN